MSAMRRPQLALAAILLVAAAVFAVGAIAERSQSETHTEPAAQEHPASPHDEGQEETEAAGGRRPASEPAERGEELLGIDTESTPLIAMAVLAGLGLAAVAASSLGRRIWVLAAIAAIMVIWTGLDVREVVHQLDESRTGIAVAAIIAAGLHLAAAILAGALAARASRADIGSTGRAGTMPA